MIEYWVKSLRSTVVTVIIPQCAFNSSLPSSNILEHTTDNCSCEEQSMSRPKLLNFKENPSHHTRLAKAMRGVIPHQTKEEQASANEQTRQRMVQILAEEAAQQRVARLDYASF
ncbi:hypothetical protein TNCV_3859741 [Trichonephila clavipes]|nr:hypothetical protein TNCV_3859741 [Trichonephila clavipes]